MSKTISTGYISDTINNIKVNSSLKCNSGNYNNNASRSVSYVVMHYTGNAKDTAKANANYFTGSGRNASAHLFVDDTDIYQSVELRDTAWHCGASSYKHASCRNANSIGIEMCCTARNYKISDTTKKNAAYVCAYICKLLGISASGVDTYVVRHYDVTGKTCPAQMVSNTSEWTEFKSMVKNILNGGTATSSSGSTSTGSSEMYRVRKSWSDASSQKGAFTSLSNAKKCADQNSGYSVFDSSGNKVYPTSTTTSASTTTTSSTKSGYTGTYPALPPRGYYKQGDGITTLTNYPTQIKRVQQLVNWINGGSITVDGKYGPNTVSAVKTAQKALGVTADGQFGSKTLAAAKTYKK